jgi:site-specific recombinase XerD
LHIEVANGDATADTIKAYHREVAAWVRWCAEQGIDPRVARREDVVEYREALKVAGNSVATRKFKLSIVRRFYAAMVRHGLMAGNPAESFKAGKDLTSADDKMKVLSEGALSALMNAIPGDTLTGKRDRAIIALMAVHGLRRVEIHRLDPESLQSGGGEGAYAGPHLVVDGKGHKRRNVYLREDTHSAVSAYLRAKLEAGLPLDDGLFVAHGNHGRGHRLSRQALNAIVGRYLNAASLKRAGVSCHALRHTFGTLSVAGGAKVEHVRDAMGHSKLETTSIYVRAVERARNNPAYFINVKV